MAYGKLIQLLRLISGSAEEQHQVCKVVSVDKTKRTAKVAPLNGDAEFDVKLQANEDMSTGNVIYPAINSNVIVGYIDKIDAYVEFYSNIDSMELMGSNHEGLVKVAVATDKLNALEQDVNTLKQIFTAWVVAPGDGGSALKLAAATWAGSPITQTTKAELQNNKVVHGS